MAHGGYAGRRDAERRPVGRRGKGPGVDKGSSKIKKKQKKQKTVSLKNQIRSTERMLRKTLPPEIRAAQEKKLEDLKNQQELQKQLAVKRKIFLKGRKIKFFERRKIERMIRRLERQQRTTSDPNSEALLSEQLAKLKEDLEYVRFYPKNERYVSLFMGGDNEDMVNKRNIMRKQIKDSLVSAAASGKDLEETGSDDDELLEVSEDDFFASGTSSDEADADDEWTDKSARELTSSTSGRATSGMSGDEKSKKLSDRAKMPPPRAHKNTFRTTDRGQSNFTGRKKDHNNRAAMSTSNHTSNRRSGKSATNWVSSGHTDLSRVPSGRAIPSRGSTRPADPRDSTGRADPSRGSTAHTNRSWGSTARAAPDRGSTGDTNPSRGSSGHMDPNRVSGGHMDPNRVSGGHTDPSRVSSGHTGLSSNLSSNSDAHKPRRKRRPKKKRQVAES